MPDKLMKVLAHVLYPRKKTNYVGIYPEIFGRKKIKHNNTKVEINSFK